MDDSIAEDVRQKLSALGEKHFAELARSEVQLLALAETAVERWHAWWRVPTSAYRFSIESRLDRKFRVCFPLSANAINHVEGSLAARTTYPWVAKAGARIAFEHALTAQWVLLTAHGEDRLKARLDYSSHQQRKRFLRSVSRLSDENEDLAQEVHGLSAEQLDGLIGAEPEGLGLPKFDALCGRFAGGGAHNLLYDVYSDQIGRAHV